MGDVKRKYKRTQINTSTTQLIDIETGELTEIKNAALYKSSPTNVVSIDYKSYVYLDTNKLSILISRGIKQVELALLISLSCQLQNRYCVCLKNGDEPHTTKSIALLIGETPQSAKAKLNTLVKEGVLAYTKSIGNKSWGNVYIMNPHIIKKGVVLSKSLCEIFDDITKPELAVTIKEAFKL